MMLARQWETQEEEDNNLTGWSEHNKEKVFPQILFMSTYYDSSTFHNHI